MGDYNVKDFGIKIDGKEKCTENIQKIIDTCYKEGGGRIVFEKGVYKTGTIFLKSNIEIYLESGCKIIGSEDLNDYKELEADGFLMKEINPKRERTKNALIIGAFVENITIRGMGEIDGSGLSFYKNTPSNEKGKYNKPEIQRPRIMILYKCKNVKIENISLIDSPCWTIWLMQCENVNIKGIKIFGDRRMRNVDGIDIDACKNVIVSDSIIDTEDDCFAIQSNQGIFSSPAVCENIVITNCTLKTDCQGIRVGCPNVSEIKNCTFSNLVIESKNNGIIFENPHRYFDEKNPNRANIHDILFSNIIINCEKFPILLLIEEGIKLVQLSNITFSNIKIPKCGKPITIQGSKETTIKNINFYNIEMNVYNEDGIVCKYSENIKFNNVYLNSLKS